MSESIELPDIPMNSSHYTPDDRRQVAALYAVHGNMKRVREITGIPDATLSNWKNTEWFHAHLELIRNELKDEMVGKLEAITLDALDETHDRVKHGDYTASGERVPMKGKDLATIAAINIDKRQILLAKPTSIRGDSSEGMKDLANQFRELARQVRDERVVDVQEGSHSEAGGGATNE